MSTFELVNTGILMGIIHVLTGPDHLSALATLSGTNIQNNTRREAFLLGVRWGVGHSFGLLLVGGLLIALEESSGEWIGMDPLLSTIFESFVGVFMLCLGAYGLFKADKNNRESILMGDTRTMKDDDDARSAGSGMFEISDDIAAMMEDVLETDSRCSGYDDLSACLSTEEYLADFLDCKSTDGKSTGGGGPSDMSMVTVPMKLSQQGNANNATQDQQQPQSQQPLPGTIAHFNQKRRGSNISELPLPSTISHFKSKRRGSNVSELMTAMSLVSKHTEQSSILSNRGGFYDRYCYFFCGEYGRTFFTFTPGILALVAGVVHGVAGPGAVLGVIPAVQLRDPQLAVIYLGTFCLTSTMVMGGFAAFYDTLTQWLAGVGRKAGMGHKAGGGNRVFMVEVGSALLSLSVGVIWLVLLALGKLDEVFP